jgi:hypothetical protein
LLTHKVGLDFHHLFDILSLTKLHCVLRVLLRQPK